MARIPEEKQRRAAEIVGLGLSHAEAAGAVGIGASTVDRILQKPEYRKIAEDVRRQRTSVAAEVGSVIRDLLSATNKDGNPDMAARQRGAELYAKNPTLIDSLEMTDDDDMLPGVVLRFPNPGSDASRDGADPDIRVVVEPETGRSVVECEHCGQERWVGIGPCGSCGGAPAPVTFSEDDLAPVEAS